MLYMTVVIIVIIVVSLFFIVILTNKTPEEKSHSYQSYQDDKIINDSLGKNYSSDGYYGQSEYIKISDVSKVKVKIYHESNYVVVGIRGGFVRKYHQDEGMVLSIRRDEEYLYFKRFLIRIGNHVLNKQVTIIKTDLQELIKETESQFYEWAVKADKIETNSIEPNELSKRLQANRKYLSDNKKKLALLKETGNMDKFSVLLSKMQLRYDEIIASGGSVREEHLKELEAMGLKVNGKDSNVSISQAEFSTGKNNSKKKKLSIVFELKGLYYRTAFEQLAAVMLEVGDSLRLELEPDNDKDPTAIKVFTKSNDFIGYVDKDQSALVTSVYDRIISCTVIKKTRHQIPYITCKIEFTE